MAGGAAVWCWYDVRAGCCCPLLYSYVGRGGVRSPTGAGIIGPARGGGARPVQIGGDLPGGGRHRTAHGKRPGKIAPRKTGNKKRGRRGGGPCLPLFSRQIFGRLESPAAGAAVVHVGRLESVAGHSFPRGCQNIPRHTFPGTCRRGGQIFVKLFWYPYRLCDEF